MGRLIRLIFQDPQVILGILTIVPYIVTTVLTVLIASSFWTKKLSGDRGIILAGAIISLIAFIVSNLVNYVILPNFGYDIYQEYMSLIQANYVIGAIGSLLFSWGVYRYFVNLPKERAEKEEIDPFITRND